MADNSKIEESTKAEFEAAAKELKTELDEVFKSKISTPEQVITVYTMLHKYKLISGEDYKITFEENTIV